MQIAKAELRVSVRAYDGHILGTAQVELGSNNDKKFKPVVLKFDKNQGVYLAHDLLPGTYTVKVSAKDMESQERELTINSGEQDELFMLGKAGMPSYYRGRVKVPFEPRPAYLGVVLKHEPHEQKEGEAFLAEAVKKFALRPVKSHNNHRVNNLVIVEAAGADEGKMAEIQRFIAGSDRFDLCAPVLQLPEKNATLLTSNIIVKFRSYVTESEIPEIAKRFGLKTIRHIPYAGNAYEFAVPGLPSMRVLEICEKLVASGKVEYAEPDLWHTMELDTVTPTDFLFPEQWDHPIINTPAAWQTLRDINVNKTFGDPNVIVALFDSGVDAANPSFSGTLTDGSNKVYRLYDFVAMVPNNNDLSDSGHGTCTASAAVGKANDPSSVPGVNDGTVGIAGNCKVMGIRRTGGTNETRYSDAYIWTAGFDPHSATPGFPAPFTPGADIISNSFGFSVGSPISGLMADTFDFLTSYGRNGKGVMLFFSTGNNLPKIDFTLQRPWAAYKKTMACGASSLQNDGVTEVATNYSNFGMQLDFCAPSHTTYGPDGGPVHNPPQNYGAWSAARVARGNVPGRPTVQTTVNTAAAAAAGSIVVASTAGLAVGQGILIGNPGAANTEAKNIAGINVGTKTLTLSSSDIEGVNAPSSAALFHPHGVGINIRASSADYTNCMGGTSYSTPVCAGIAALVLSVNPNLNWIEVRTIIRNSAVKIDPNNNNATGRWRDVNGLISTDPGYAGPFFSQWYGYGRVSAAAAVASATTFVNNADIIVRDNLADVGNNPSAGTYWNSPDIWVRRQDPLSDGPAALPANYATPGPHLNPVRTHNNWVYVRVKNRGIGTSGNFYLRAYIAHWPGTEFVFPDNFIPTNNPGSPIPSPMKPGTYLIGEASVSSMNAGEERVLSLQWNMNAIPPETVLVNGSNVHWHPCLLVQITPQDGPMATGNHVWDSNNLGQKNISIDDMDSGLGGDFQLAFVVGNLTNLNRLSELEIVRGKLPKTVDLYLRVIDQRVLEFIAQSAKKDPNAGYRIGEHNGEKVVFITAAAKVRIPINRTTSRLIPMVLGCATATRPKKGSSFEISINQFDHGQVLTGSYGARLDY